MDADADIGLLEALEGEIAARLRMMARTDPKPVLELLEDTLSNSVQITEPRACAGGEPAGGAGAVDADVRGAAEGEGGAPAHGTRGDCRGDADGV